MHDLAFQDALDDPESPFRKFVEKCVALWNRAVEVYEAAGSPNGPAEDDDNVTRWFGDKMAAKNWWRCISVAWRLRGKGYRRHRDSRNKVVPPPRLWSRGRVAGCQARPMHPHGDFDEAVALEDS